LLFTCSRASKGMKSKATTSGMYSFILHEHPCLKDTQASTTDTMGLPLL
jgi:hypothetical protein